MLLISKLIVKKSPIHGYGVFANQDFQPGDIIEECYSLLADSKNTDFKNYYFQAADKIAIPLGFGCIYNHSNQPNANYGFDVESSLIIFSAHLPIQRGEEILVSYGKSWFEERNARPIHSWRTKLRWLLPTLRIIFRFSLVSLGLVAFYFLLKTTR